MNSREQTEVGLMVQLGIIRQLMATREAKLFANVSLNPSQFGVLNHFTHNPERSWTVTELAGVMEMNQPGITKVVTVLLDKKLLESGADKEDKRRRYLKITPQGLKLCDEILGSLLPDISHIFESWEDGEISQMHQQMEKLMRWLDEHREDIKNVSG
ncbi:MarR family winged helix-turn-helix transcriptional regulator [Amphritea japonica]|uniref:MarR family winged helix-turn-helix transcriptional regulator n=1 Tax=Amphritea japonica TaxID=452627 RepID=UPI000475BE10|nr:MarR family winged helix-turn-helix transcriptional regulator [Amphritea japonica]